jgi:hypothetical protein
VTQAALPKNFYDVWHDRAVFHFLTDSDDRRRYVETLKRSLKPGGHVVLATFAEDGPTKCSGLDVERYNAGKMLAALGGEFELLAEFREEHQTPSGTAQKFQYGNFRRRG